MQEKKRCAEKRKQTYLEITSQVLDDADQQLGLAIGEGGVRGVRHGCLLFLMVCFGWHGLYLRMEDLCCG